MARCDALVAIDILGGVEIMAQLESFMECNVACRFQATGRAFRTCAVCHFTQCGLISSRSEAQELLREWMCRKSKVFRCAMGTWQRYCFSRMLVMLDALEAFASL